MFLLIAVIDWTFIDSNPISLYEKSNQSCRHFLRNVYKNFILYIYFFLYV